VYYIFLVMGQQSEIGIERVWADAYSTVVSLSLPHGARSLCPRLWKSVARHGVPHIRGTAVLFRLSPQAPPRLLCVNLWTRIGPFGGRRSLNSTRACSAAPARRADERDPLAPVLPALHRAPWARRCT